jgi:hypothetical protein
MKLKDLFPADLQQQAEESAGKRPGKRAMAARGEEEPPELEEEDEQEQESEGQEDMDEDDAAARPPAGRGRAAQAPESGGQQASPEEQDAYERVVLAGVDVLTNAKTSDAVLELMGSNAEDPPMAIALAAQLIIGQLDEQSGGQIPETVILPATMEIAEQAAELAQKAGLFEVSEDVLQTAGQNAVMLVGGDYDVSEEDIQAFLSTLPEQDVMAMGQQQGQIAQRAMQRGQPAPQGGMNG